jgi:hypothetical protein
MGMTVEENEMDNMAQILRDGGYTSREIASLNFETRDRIINNWDEKDDSCGESLFDENE